MLAVGRGVPFRAVPARGPVLDLSRRADAADVARRLAGTSACAMTARPRSPAALVARGLDPGRARPKAHAVPAGGRTAAQPRAAGRPVRVVGARPARGVRQAHRLRRRPHAGLRRCRAGSLWSPRPRADGHIQRRRCAARRRTRWPSGLADRPPTAVPRLAPLRRGGRRAAGAQLSRRRARRRHRVRQRSAARGRA